MSNLEDVNAITPPAIEMGSMSAGLVFSSLAAMHSLDAYGRMSAPWVQEIPWAGQSTSVSGSFVAGLVTVASTECLAGRLERRGHENAAGRLRRAGEIISWLVPLSASW